MYEDHCADFLRVVTEPTSVEQIAVGAGIREHAELVRLYGGDRWRKMKGRATIETFAGEIVDAEIHWYEAHGVGRRRFKAKRVFRSKTRRR